MKIAQHLLDQLLSRQQPAKPLIQPGSQRPIKKSISYSERSLSTMLSYDHGTWEQAPSTLADARDITDFVRRVGVLGFSRHCMLSCCLGTLTIYVQDTLRKNYPFEYICLFEQTRVPLLVKDFPSLIQLLHEVGAQPEEMGQILLRLETLLKQTTTILQEFLLKDNLGNRNAFNTQASTQTRQPLPNSGNNKVPLPPRRTKADL